MPVSQFLGLLHAAFIVSHYSIHRLIPRDRKKNLMGNEVLCLKDMFCPHILEY